MSIYAKFRDLGEEGNQPGANHNNSYVELEHIESIDHKNTIIGQNKVVVIDTYGTWCGPCKAVEPKFAQLAQQYNNQGVCMLVKEDVDKGFSEGVRGVPLFQFYKNGQFVDNVMGADIRKVEAKIIELLNDDTHPHHPQ